jgi:hypothetical protein
MVGFVKKVAGCVLSLASLFIVFLGLAYFVLGSDAGARLIHVSRGCRSNLWRWLLAKGKGNL